MWWWERPQDPPLNVHTNHRTALLLSSKLLSPPSEMTLHSIMFLWSGGAAVAAVEKNWNSIQVSDKGRFSRNEYSRQQCLGGIKKEKEINRESVVTAAASVSALTQFHLHTWRSLLLLQVLFIYWWFIGKKKSVFCAFNPCPMQQTTLLTKPALIPFILFMLTLKHQFCHINFYFNALWADHQILGDSGRNADDISHFSASKFRKSKERWELCRKK